MLGHSTRRGFQFKAYSKTLALRFYGSGVSPPPGNPTVDASLEPNFLCSLSIWAQSVLLIRNYKKAILKTLLRMKLACL